MKIRGKHLLKTANCAQKRSKVRNGKTIMRIFSLKGNHEVPKKKETKITVSITELKILSLKYIFIIQMED